MRKKGKDMLNDEERIIKINTSGIHNFESAD
jgi:hypothetical protein